MKKNLMTVAFFVASLAASAQVQSAVILQTANPFPFQTDALKEAWINANPKDYVRMGGDKPIVPTTATGATPEFTAQADKDAWLVQQEANAMLAKQAAINATNPPTVITQAEKEAWLEAQNASQVQAELNAKLQFISDNGIIIETVTP